MNRIVAASIAACVLLASLPLAASPPTRLNLQDAVALALRQNPALAGAVASYRSAKWGVVGEDAVFSPTLQANVAADHREQPAVTREGIGTRTAVDSLRVGAGLVQRLRLGSDLALRVQHENRWEERDRNVELLAVGPVYDTSARLELTQPLWRGAGRTIAEAPLRVAREQETEAEHAASRLASELVRDVLTAWWELWYAEEAVLIEGQALVVAERQRDEARRRVELGTEAPVALLTFETRVAERMEGVATAARQRQERSVALAAQLGDVSLQIVPGEPFREAVRLPPSPEIRELAKDRSPEVREAESALQVAATRSEVAADPFRPRLDVQGYAEAGGLAPAFVGFGGDDRFAWAAGVNLIFELPLDGNLHRAAFEQARLSVEVSERRLEQARLRAVAEAEAELARFESAKARLELASQTVNVAEAQLRAEQRRYEIGTATPIDLLQAEDSVRSARLRQARAEVDLKSAEASLEHLIGALGSRWVPELS